MSRMLSPWLAVVALLMPASVRGDEDAANALATTRPTALSLESADATTDELEPEEAEEQRRLVEELRKQQEAERRNEAAARGDTRGFQSTAPYREVRAIEPPDGAGQILAFHPLTDGGLVIATGATKRYGQRTLAEGFFSLLRSTDTKPKPKPTNQLIWVDASGAQRQAAPLPFACKGVTVAPDGAVIAVGDDRVVVFSPEGENLAEATAPHLQPTEEERAAFEAESKEQYREMLEIRQQQLKQYTTVKDAIEAIPEEERTTRQQRELTTAVMVVKSMEESIKRHEAAPEQWIAGQLAAARSIHRVAASRDLLFLVAREPSGYGVWRCGRDFTAPEKIVGGLSGCCGQMDVQVVGDELVIAENSRHRVAIYAFDGEPLRTFGQASRTDVRKGFGGCCNPMNACPGPDGTLLLSESSGLVKQFAPDGTLVEILAAADVPSGCKNSSIGLSTDGLTLYYLDIEKGRVLVLEKKS